MIEQYLAQLYIDLGSTGLLLLGLYYIMLKVGRMISSHLSVINHNSSEIATYMRMLTAQYLKEHNGKTGGGAEHTVGPS